MRPRAFESAPSATATTAAHAKTLGPKFAEHDSHLAPKYRAEARNNLWKAEATNS